MTGVVACLKWVDRSAQVDPLSGLVRTDPRSSGASEADLAALETALSLAEAWGGKVTAVTAGGPAADALLRDAVAAGAERAVRVDMDGDEWPSAAVAAALAPVAAGAAVVICGAWSLDRGSGAVPAFLAAELGAAQALGLVAVGATGPGVLTAERRLDGGRRERLRLTAPAVLSVEAGAARLRRASLPRTRMAASAVIDVRVPDLRQHSSVDPVAVGPYRPPALARPAPAGATARERVLRLTGAAPGAPAAARVVEAPPEKAAEAVLAQLRAWGYLPPEGEAAEGEAAEAEAAEAEAAQAQAAPGEAADGEEPEGEAAEAEGPAGEGDGS